LRRLSGLGLLFLGAATGGAGACAIDDDIAWITGEECTGSCQAAPAESLACDVDSSCTPAAGCLDWDCSEDGLQGDDSDGRGEVSADAAADADAGAPSSECAANSGGASPADARPLALNVTEAELSSCPADSSWFRFSVAAGVRFVVDVRPYEGSEVAFRLYAEDETLLAGAEMDEPAGFAADAATGATYYLRVRSATAEIAYYALTIRTDVE
jgi:hypothetical protein